MRRIKKLHVNFMVMMFIICLTTGLFVMPAHASESESPDADRMIGTILSITKDILIYNTEGLEVYGPNVTYTYTIRPAEGVRASITDKIGHIVQVKDGIERAVSENAQVTFALSTGDASPIMSVTPGSTETRRVSNSFTVTVNEDKFYAPGVYRYVIKDMTSDEALASAGITRPENYDKVRYLDIYVGYDLADQDEDGSTDDFYISGCVLFRAKDSGGDTEYGVGVSFVYNDASSGAAKVTGYDVESETGDDGLCSDAFYTYNVTVTKTVSGTLGDKTNAWAFRTELDNLKDRRYILDFANAATTVTPAVTEGAEIVATESDTAANTAANTVTVIETSLKNKQSFKIIGLLADTQVRITEYNNISLDYNAVVTANGEPVDYYVDGRLSSMIPSESYGGTGWLAAKDAEDIVFSNSLDALSPTGIVLRFGPNLMMLMMAIATLFLMQIMDRDDDVYDVI